MLIQKYLNGELDEKAMHQLEKRSQDDPFLMDAMEGYETTGGVQQQHLNELTNRLQERVAVKATRVIPWRIISIAASILIVFTIGGILLYKTPHTATPQVATIVKPPAKTAPTAVQIIKPEANEIASVLPEPVKKAANHTTHKNKAAAVVQEAQPDALAALMGTSKDTTAQDTTPLNEMIVMSVESEKDKKQALANNNASAKVTNGNDTQLKKDFPVGSTPGYKGDASNPQQLLQGKVAGVTVQTAGSPPPAGSNYLYGNNLSKNILLGRVVSQYDKQPLPGVSVSVAGTNIGTQTDAEGRFKLHVDSTAKANLIIGFIGYQTVKISASKRDSLGTIAMVPANSSLSEVVVTGYGSRKADTDDEGVIVNAHPQTGWSTFRKYLTQNAVSPDGKAGTVKLSFTVDSYGTISSVKVIKSVSTATDQKAIDLLRQGTVWVGSSSGKTESVTVRVKF